MTGNAHCALWAFGRRCAKQKSATATIQPKWFRGTRTVRGKRPKKISQLLRQSFATAPKPAPGQRRAALSIPFCTRHLQHSKPFVYGPRAADAKLTIYETREPKQFCLYTMVHANATKLPMAPLRRRDVRDIEHNVGEFVRSGNSCSARCPRPPGRPHYAQRGRARAAFPTVH